MEQSLILVDPVREQQREEICAVTDAILRLAQAGFQNVPLEALRPLREALQVAVRMTEDRF